MSKPRRSEPEIPIPNLPSSDESEIFLCALAELYPPCRRRLESETTPDDFAGPLTRKFREIVLRVGKDGVELPHHAVLKAWPPGEDPVESISDLFKCTDALFPMPKDWNFHFQILKDLSTKRGIARRANDLLLAACNGHSPSELLEIGTNVYREVLSADPAAQRRCKPIGDLLADYCDAVTAPKQRKLRTGLWSLDSATDGIAAGEVLTVVARPQVGKSALAGQIIVNCAPEGIPAAFFSLEMPREQALERLLQTAWGLSRHQVEALAKGGFKGMTQAQGAALESLRKNVAIVDRGKSNVADLDASMQEAAGILGKAPRLAVVDYLGLMGSGAKNLPLYQRVSEAAVDLKSFAKRHHVALILLSQAGRDQDEARSEGAGPLGLDAARDSGQVEEACDFLVTLWRPELRSRLSVEDRAEVRGQLKGHLVKNRRGPLPLFHFRLDAPTVRITDDATEGPK